MSIIDQAVKLYIDKEIKERPARDFDLAIELSAKEFTNLCRKAGYNIDQEIKICDAVLFPFIKEVKNNLRKMYEQV